MCGAAELAEHCFMNSDFSLWTLFTADLKLIVFEECVVELTKQQFSIKVTLDQFP